VQACRQAGAGARAAVPTQRRAGIGGTVSRKNQVVRAGGGGVRSCAVTQARQAAYVARYENEARQAGSGACSGSRRSGSEQVNRQAAAVRAQAGRSGRGGAGRAAVAQAAGAGGGAGANAAGLRSWCSGRQQRAARQRRVASPYARRGSVMHRQKRRLMNATSVRDIRALLTHT